MVRHARKTVERVCELKTKVPCSLHAGKGYFYFEFEEPHSTRFHTHSVYVNNLNDLTLEQWVDEFKHALKEAQQ